MTATLAGYTVGVTAHRRAEELGGMLERRGARVLYGPAMRIVALPDDGQLREVTRALVATPPDIVVVTTGGGFQGWLEAAQGWGMGAGLLAALGGATLLARGPKARGAVRGAELTEQWSPESESSAEVLDHLLENGVAGARVAVQLHGDPQPGFLGALADAGAEVVRVPVYRWEPPDDLEPLDQLLDAALDRAVSALTFTSAPAVAGLLRRATERDREQLLVECLRHDVLAACVGPVTAEPLVAHRLPTLQPERARTGALVRALSEALPARAQSCTVAGHELVLRDHAALVDGQLRTVPPAPMVILRTLACGQGRVMSRDELLAALPGNCADVHAVESAVARLRTALGAPELVATVVKRGYRLALEADPD